MKPQEKNNFVDCSENKTRKYFRNFVTKGVIKSYSNNILKSKKLDLYNEKQLKFANLHNILPIIDGL